MAATQIPSAILPPGSAVSAAATDYVDGARTIAHRPERLNPTPSRSYFFWMMMPAIVVIIPIYMMFQAVGLLDTHLALIIVYAVGNLPIVVWLMHDFFASLPVELEESAQLDGSSRFGIFWEIVLPLTRPGLAATTLLTLILNWNEYIFAVFLSTAKAQTMPIMVAAKNAGEKGILWWEMCAIIVIMIIPVILMAIILQRYIAKGVLLGAVKG